MMRAYAANQPLLICLDDRKAIMTNFIVIDHLYCSLLDVRWWWMATSMIRIHDLMDRACRADGKTGLRCSHDR